MTNTHFLAERRGQSRIHELERLLHQLQRAVTHSQQTHIGALLSRLSPLPGRSFHQFARGTRHSSVNRSPGLFKTMGYSIADFITLSAVDLTSGLGFALNQPGVRGKLLHRFETVDVAVFIKDYQGQNAADTGNCESNAQ